MKKNEYNLLLMTSAIKSVNFNTENDIKIRLDRYIETIKYYLNINNINGIVFIDSQGFDFEKSKEFEEIKKLAEILGKDLELLSFNQDMTKIIEINYGYGEFQTLEYMKNNSKLLLKTDSLYKISGRYIVSNIQEIIDKSSNLDSLIYKFGILDFFTYMTLFFKINKNQLNFISNNYEKICIDIQKKSEKKNHYIMIGEYIFFEILYNKFKLDSISIYPKYQTLSNKKYHIFTILLKIGYLNINNPLIKVLTFIFNKFPYNLKLRYLKGINYIAGKLWS